jgi:excisionase family DNA binding protein
MWNVSESTVKRWADQAGLHCHRTPGGHRRFRLQDLREFQENRAFEATGILTTEDWEDPELEVWLNSRNFTKVRELLVYLASQNQRAKIDCLLDRLYLRGMRIEDIYDDVLVPIPDVVQNSRERGELADSQALLVSTNLEESLYHLYPNMIRKRKNGKTALCAAPCRNSRLPVLAMSQALEIEGWDSLNMGEDVSFDLMSELVELEPVNLVCLFFSNGVIAKERRDCGALNKITRSYRIPVVCLSEEGSDLGAVKNLTQQKSVPDLKAFCKYVSSLAS